LASAVLSHTNSWKQQWLNMANWSLWSGCLFAIATAIAGWLAYNSVAHDSASHAAMTLHRNWALPTATLFLLLGLWAIFTAKKARQPGFMFLTVSLTAAGLLMVTGWLGAEGVYRYGLGVKSLPVVAEGADGHNHSHGAEHDDSTMGEHQPSTIVAELPTKSDSHQHDHENPEIAPETKPSVSVSTDGHDHTHETKHELVRDERQHTAEKMTQPVKEDVHQHANNTTPAKIESPATSAEHAHQLKPVNLANEMERPSIAELHDHDSNRTNPTTLPFHQDNAAEQTTLTHSKPTEHNHGHEH
jgi:uncharacterized membrane protein